MSARRMRMVSPTPTTWAAATTILAAMAFSAAFLLVRYERLPDLLPVLFGPHNTPIGWQWKTYPRVLMPVLVQAVLALVSGVIASLVLSRPHGERDDAAEDVVAARTAAEALVLFAMIWVVFQAYAAVALVRMWQTSVGGLGRGYGVLTVAGIALTAAVAVRAHRRFGKPSRRTFVAEHWRLGQLYNNPADPALFVPTRDGARWTLNFGRPVAAGLIGVVLAVGIVAPLAILKLLLR